MALALAVTAAGLVRVTSSRATAGSPGKLAPVETMVSKSAIPFRLVLSAPAGEVVVETTTQIRPAPGDGTISGKLEIDPANPTLGLIVRWKKPAAEGEHRFAKLTLEAPGQPTFTHVFDAEGDIDDFLELPFPAAK
jgi:hypothetical protein